MKNIKLFHILFSLAIIAALALASLPMAPAYALSASAGSTASISASQADVVPAIVNQGVICRDIVVWKNGHRYVRRVCYRNPRPTN
jgi:hypothetical protein